MKVFREHRNERVCMDCYILDEQAEEAFRAPRPAVVVCPGSGYAQCAMRESEAVALQFAAAGFHSFVLWYTVTDSHPIPLWPEPLMDAAWAVSAVRGHAVEWSVRRDSVYILGFSAGGHVAASLSVFWDSDGVRRAYPNARPDGSALCYPVITSGEFAHQGSIDNLAGQAADLRALASLENFVGERTPPAFLWHTFGDQAVPVQNSLMYAGALARHGVPFELHVYPEGNHGLSLAKPEIGEALTPNNRHVGTWISLCCDWIALREGLAL
ncbi:MAG: alpha/beta hydrolase [Clostridiales bacterium]|jgi:acetyl esterase/lipase|nr:alpha/beta hydrolase [Clostridiales bacterium]